VKQLSFNFFVWQLTELYYHYNHYNHPENLNKQGQQTMAIAKKGSGVARSPRVSFFPALVLSRQGKLEGLATKV